MRLLFLNYEFPPDGGGAGFATLALAREFVRRGHRVDVLTSRASGTPASEQIDGVALHRVRVRRRGVHDVGLAAVIGFLGAAALALPRLARRERFDLCHYYFGVPTGLLSLVPGAHRSLPYVVSLRGSDVPGYEPSLAPLHRLLAPLTRRIWRGAAAVVANSSGLRDIAIRTSIRPDIHVIRNGLYAEGSGSRSVAARPVLRLQTTCRLIERKGVDVLLRALALVQDLPLELDVVGDGPRRAALESLAGALGLGDRVRFHGFLPQSQLATLRAEVDAFVLASTSESCSMALLEAIGAGLPVLATAAGGTPELVQQDVNGLLFPVNDSNALAAALRRFATDPALRRQLAAGSRRLANETFSWQSSADSYETLFAAAIERHRRVRGRTA